MPPKDLLYLLHCAEYGSGLPEQALDEDFPEKLDLVVEDSDNSELSENKELYAEDETEDILNILK